MRCDNQIVVYIANYQFFMRRQSILRWTLI